MDIKGIIFDVDGTLVDSNDAHAHAWVKAFAEHGHQVDFKAVRRSIGMGSDKLVPAVSDLKEAPDISERRGEIFKAQYLPTLNAFHDARALLERLRADGYQLAVASSAKEDELEHLLKLVGAEFLLERKTSSDDAKESKPDPDIVEAALRKLNLPLDEVMMIGDTPYDVEAAQKAGIRCLALRCGGWGDEGLRTADWVYDSPADLLQCYGQWP